MSTGLLALLVGIALAVFPSRGHAEGASPPDPCLAGVPKVVYRSLRPVERPSAKRIKGVLEACEERLKATPANHLLHLAVAALSYRVGKKQRCNAILSRADLSETAEGAHLRAYYRFSEAKSRADLAAARRWFVKASKLGHVRATVFLGYYAEGGYIKPRDNKEALSWYRLAAKRGSGEAHYKVGVFYDAGWGVKKSTLIAIQWYRKASELGDGIAAYDLGYHYLGGFGRKRQHAKAFKWFGRAAELGYAPAFVELGKMHARGFFVKKSRRKAREMFRRAAALGLAEGYYELASDFEWDKSDATNLERAVAFYFEGAKRGHPESMVRIARIFEGDVRPYREDVPAAYFWHTAMWLSGIGTRSRSIDDEKVKLFKGYLGAAEFDRITRMAKAWKPGQPLPTRFARPPMRER